MKQKVAPELDCLMWTLVEEGNERAVEEFHVRYPELRIELERRAQMVNGLKKLRPEGELKLAPPPFKPSEKPQPLMPARTMAWVTVLVLAAIGVASFTASYFLIPAEKPVPAPVQAPAVPDSSTFEPEQIVPKEPAPPPAIVGDEVGPEQSVPAGQKELSIKMTAAPLHVVLESVGKQAGFKVVIAPGTQNPSIDVQYDSVAAMDILRHLGEEHGFTPFDQGDGSIVIVPAVDESGGTQSASGPRDPRRLGG